jgi:hypothetical protein
MIYQVWEIVSQGRPADSDSMRPVYDRAVQVWQGEGQSKDALAHAFRDAVRNLRARAQTRSDCGAGAAETERVMSAIDQRLSEGNEEYLRSFDSCWSDVSAVMRVLRGGEGGTGVTQDHSRVASASPLPYIDPPLFVPPTDHYLNGFGDVQAVALEARVTQDLILLFGSESVARDSINALANAYIASAGDSASAQSDAARELHSQLSRIPADKEIWSRPGFQQAMAALGRGNLREGLGFLQGEGLFATAYDTLNNLHQITLSQRALVRFRGGLTLRLLNFRENQDEFMEFRRGTRRTGYDWDLLHGDLGIHYINLLVSGYDQRYAVDRGTGTLVPFGGRTRVEGDGGAIELTPALTWGANLGIPATMTLHGAFGYRWWSVQAEVPTPSGVQTLEAKANDPYVGLWGLHFNLVGWEGSQDRFRLDNFGAGAIGINPMAYLGWGWRYSEVNHWRYNGRLTLPHYVLFHGERANGFQREYFFQHRFSADLRPIDVTHQFSNNWSLLFGPGFRYTLSTEFDGADRIVHSMEPYAHATLNSQNNGFSLEARIGGRLERGGEEWQRIPDSPYGSLNIILTPEIWFRSRGSSQPRSVDRSPDREVQVGGSVQAGGQARSGGQVQDAPAPRQDGSGGGAGGSRR